MLSPGHSKAKPSWFPPWSNIAFQWTRKRSRVPTVSVTVMQRGRSHSRGTYRVLQSCAHTYVHTHVHAGGTPALPGAQGDRPGRHPPNLGLKGSVNKEERGEREG